MVLGQVRVAVSHEVLSTSEVAGAKTVASGGLINCTCAMISFSAGASQSLKTFTAMAKTSSTGIDALRVVIVRATKPSLRRLHEA
jgi:hypothetical protein